MVQRTLDAVYRYNDSFLNSEGLLDTMLVSSFTGPSSGTLDVDDSDGDKNWDSSEAATWNGEEATLIGSGEASVSVSIFGIPLSFSSSVPFNAWEANGATYIEYTDGEPAALLDGLLSEALDIPFLSSFGVDRLVSIIERNAILDFDLTNQNEIDLPVCFAKGTKIRTPFGWVPIEDIKVGDLVSTQDHGAQPVRWVGHASVAAEGVFAPVEIAAGVLGNDRKLILSQQHRVLHRSPQAQLLFGTQEMLVAAKFLVDGTSVCVREGGFVTYYHLLFSQHELVFSEGIATESFHPGDMADRALTRAECNEIYAIFPELKQSFSGYGSMARRAVRSFEAKVLKESAVL